jgi:uncharacterized membrane protein
VYWDLLWHNRLEFAIQAIVSHGLFIIKSRYKSFNVLNLFLNVLSFPIMHIILFHILAYQKVLGAQIKNLRGRVDQRQVDSGICSTEVRHGP